MDPIPILPEILRQIFSYLESRDARRVSQVSRHWYACSLEQLYKKPYLCKPRSIHHFLQTLLTPGLESLAARVRTLTIEWDEDDYSEPVGGCGHAIFAAAAARLHLDRPIQSPGNQALLLLHLLPRLDVLNVALPDHDNAFAAFLAASHEHADLPLALRSIRQLSCIWSLYLPGATADMLTTMFRLPRLLTLEVYVAADISTVLEADQRRMSQVTNLQIWNLQMKISPLRYILSIPRALTRLSISGVVGSHSELIGLQSALEPVKMTLEVLELDSIVIGPSVPLLLVRMWPVLRRLRCQLVMLLGFLGGRGVHSLDGVLPCSLRDLGIKDDRYWHGDDGALELVKIVKRKEQATPLLKRVGYDILGNSELALRLQSVCADAGVKLVGGGDWSK
ncbi:hypothetical protein Q9L58_006556 [Maublancomyces gigas]|uniref:F-box domain-containing protein n=1 Tax=Discina gigas TaxID=1032678 RepID=A0ABR3GF01_9PEZI